jgi:hypothetical protein
MAPLRSSPAKASDSADPAHEKVQPLLCLVRVSSVVMNICAARNGLVLVAFSLSGAAESAKRGKHSSGGS